MIKKTTILILFGMIYGSLYSQDTGPSTSMMESPGSDDILSAQYTSPWIIPDDRRIN